MGAWPLMNSIIMAAIIQHESFSFYPPTIPLLHAPLSLSLSSLLHWWLISRRINCSCCLLWWRRGRRRRRRDRHMFSRSQNGRGCRTGLTDRLVTLWLLQRMTHYLCTILHPLCIYKSHKRLITFGSRVFSPILGAKAFSLLIVISLTLREINLETKRE